MPSLHLPMLFLACDLALKPAPGPDTALILPRGMHPGFRKAWHKLRFNRAAPARQG
jgi:threonine/homoserine/homoserine lactone efflux protein